MQTFKTPPRSSCQFLKDLKKVLVKECIPSKYRILYGHSTNTLRIYRPLLREIPKFHLTFFCGNFVEMHNRVSGESPEPPWKLGFHKISVPKNLVRLRYFMQCWLIFYELFYELLFVNSYWSSKYDADVLEDRIAMNLLYVQVSLSTVWYCKPHFLFSGASEGLASNHVSWKVIL